MIFSLALRNLTRNRRRSLFTVGAISVGFIAINLFGGYVMNVFSGLKQSAIHGEALGNLTVAKAGYFGSANINNEQYIISEEELKTLNGIFSTKENVVTAAPKLHLNGLISNGYTSTIFIADAVSPQNQRILKNIGANDSAGLLPLDNDFGVIISSDLADALNAQRDEYLQIFTSTLSGQANAADIFISDIVDTGNSATNDKYLEIPIALARQLLDTQGAEKIILLFNEPEDLDQISAEIIAQAGKAGIDLEVKTWSELSAFYTQVRNMFSMIFMFIFLIVLIIVVMSVMNTMSMIIVERTREIGTLRSLGIQRSTIRKLFTTEGFVLALFACILGIIVSVSIAFFVNNAGISYTPPSNTQPVPLQINIKPILPIISLVILSLISMFFSLVPAHRASKLKIIDALRHL